MALIDRYLDAIEAEDFSSLDPSEEMVWSALATLALAISRLWPPDREATLAAIEDCGTLRGAVAMFARPPRAALEHDPAPPRISGCEPLTAPNGPYPSVH